MTNMTGREIVVGIDPVRDWHMALAWAADEAHRRALGLALALAVPPQHDTQHVDGTANRIDLRRSGAETLEAAAAWARSRHPDLELSTHLLDGFPAPALGQLSRRAPMVVLGSRHLSRTVEFLSAGSLVVPVVAQAHCPVVVVGDAEHASQQPPYMVVAVDGSESSRAALAVAFEEASIRGCALRAISVWHQPLLSFQDKNAGLQAQRRMLSETVAGWPGKYPDVALTHEVLAGHPVEELAKAAEHALALVLGRRGNGGYTGMRLGSVVHGLLHRAHCPVVTVPVPQGA
ncbi:universal stress protein [Streptomyces sp. H27-G5]|uniref:universal stress protein n=1 Tax=Streptomyces sp. H27-G5 TaxID=2996698 RepID=UPI00226F489E|nr:universal stress protein [Streptomyces sp. H27-G5]MCY0922530.1 universal stress protein [Streptomyces sp. H27-G5]